MRCFGSPYSVCGFISVLRSRLLNRMHIADFQGGAFVATMLRCIIGKRWENLGAQFSPSVGTTLQRFIGFVLFWAIELPFCSFRPNRLRWLYTLKAWTLPPSVFGLLIYCLVQSHGHLAPDSALAGTTSTPRGAVLVWLVVSSINSTMGNWVSRHLVERVDVTSQSAYT